jgi:hypothetical protein
MKKEINIETEAVKKMAFTIKIEEAVITAISVYFLSRYNLGFPVWIWVLLFFSPDISMLGYLISTSLGAYCYNLFHHKAVSLVVLGLGLLTHNNVLVAVGALLFAHSSFDRMMGYGLKYTDDFKHTNLGWMGKK